MIKGHVSYPMDTINEIKRELNSKSKAVHDDGINHPKHYTWLKDRCGVEVIDIVRHLDFNCGNIIKYVVRHGHKDEHGLSNIEAAIKDMKKARFYLDDEIKMLESKLNEKTSDLSCITNLLY